MPEYTIRMLVSSFDIKSSIAEIATSIAKDHKDTETDPLVLVIVLNGAFMFGADLARALASRRVHCQIDFLHCASYKGRKTQGMVQFFSMPKTNLRGRRVVLVEDIIDTGITIREIKESLQAASGAGIKSLKVAALLDKYEARRPDANVPVEYVGTRIINKFVVGYGLDCDGLHRELPYIGVVEAEFAPARTGHNVAEES